MQCRLGCGMQDRRGASFVNGCETAVGRSHFGGAEEAVSPPNAFETVRMGKPKVHTVQYSTRKAATHAAEREAMRAGGTVRHDAHPRDGQNPHFQAEDANGKYVKPVVHHCPPQNNC